MKRVLVITDTNQCHPEYSENEYITGWLEIQNA